MRPCALLGAFSIVLLAQPAGDVSMLTDGKLHVIVCGSGSPLPDPERAGSCTAVIAGQQVILVDAGSGSWRKATVARVPGQALSAVLLTHFHSDHIGDLGEAMTMSWTNGRSAPVDVYGPPGVERIVRGFAEAYELDGQYRVLHHGEATLPAKAHRIAAHVIEVPGPDEKKLVFQKNGVAVYAFLVDHRPIEPAYGYRIEYRGRSVVVSGDTSYCENLVRQAAGADLLLHDAMLKNFISLAAGGMAAQGQARTAKMLSDIMNYHASVQDAVKAAEAAHVGTLVLTHLAAVPGAVGGEKAFLQGAGEIFKGKLLVAHDGLRFDLDPAGAENRITPEEKAAGWRLLFDGSTYAGWEEQSRKSPPGDSFTIEDGCLKAVPHPRITEDLFTTDVFGDFELVFDWKISPGGNSGVKFRIQDRVFLPEGKGKFEDRVNAALQGSRPARAAKGQEYVIGFEYQMTDNARNSDAVKNGPMHQAGALYDIAAPLKDATKPVGEFNHSRLVARGDQVELWLNGEKVVTASLKSAAVSTSMAKRWGQGTPVSDLLVKQPRTLCQISLQNHGDAAWFKNIKIRPLP